MPKGRWQSARHAPILHRDMQLYGVRDALAEGDILGDIIELFIRREDAEQFLAECLADEPKWAYALSIEPLEFDFSAN